MGSQPQTIAFFQGERVVHTYEQLFHGGKATLSCTISEEWRELLTRSISCGHGFKRTLTRRRGVTLTHKQDLEATVKTKLGALGLGEFALGLKAATGLEMALENMSEESEEYTFAAPRCGQLTVVLYQLVRKYSFAYYDRRFLHRDSWTHTLEQWLDRIHDASKEIDPADGCCPAPVIQPPEPVAQVYMDGGSLSMLLTLLRAGQKTLLQQLHSETSLAPEQLVGSGLDFPTALLPTHLRFLADLTTPRIDVVFRPYEEAWATDSDTSVARSYIAIPKVSLAELQRPKEAGLRLQGMSEGE